MNSSLNIPNKANIKVPHGHILINKRWRGSQVAAEFGPSTRSTIVFSDSMGFVDFFPSDSTPVIYVTEVEMLTGISYNDRINLLFKEYHKKGILFVDLISSQEYGELQSKCIEMELTMIPISNQSEIPPLLISFSNIDSKHPSKQFNNCYQDSEINLEKEQIALLRGIPNVGEVNAVKLLKCYGHIKAISGLSEERLATKVGRPLANTIYTYFRDKVHF